MKKIIKIFFILIFVLLIGTMFSKVNAATANITASKQTANVGDSVDIVVSINAASWNLKLSGSISDSIVGYDEDGNNKVTSKKYTLNLTNAGTYTINLTGDITDTTDEVKYINTPININATKSQATSSNQSGGKLSSITVNGKTYSNPKQDITVWVEYETEIVDIGAKATDGSSVSGIGKVNLNGNDKTVNLTVGGTTYTVRIRKLAQVNDQPNIIDESQPQEEEPKEALALTNLKIEGFELTPEFSKDVYSYTLDINMEENDVEKLDITATANREDAKVEITGNEDLKEGENIINITLTSADEKETVTYQLKVNKIISSTEVVGKTDIDDLNNELEDTTKMSKTTQIVIITIAVVGLIAGIIFAVIEYRYTNNKDQDEFENQYNEPFYIKEDEEGRLDVIDKQDETNPEEIEDKENKTEDNYVNTDEDIQNNTSNYNIVDEPEQEKMGYIEELYKNNFSEEELEKEIENDIGKGKNKKPKGKHF